MKIIYEKGFPLLLAVTLAFQEMKWGEIRLSYAAVILVCAFTMFCLITIEKKQWNVVAGFGVLAVSIVLVLHFQGFLRGKPVYWLFVVFAVQYYVLARIMDYVYMKCILSFSFLIAFVVLRLCYVIILPWLVCFVLFWFLLSTSELIHVSYYNRRSREIEKLNLLQSSEQSLVQTLPNGENRRTLGLLPVFFLLTVCIFLMPVKREPFDWSFLMNPVTHIYDSVCNLVEDIKDLWNQDGTYFSYQLTDDEGNGESVLGGTVDSTKRILLKVSERGYSTNAIYLTGSVYDTYTGTGWAKHMDSSKSDKTEYELARMELENACMEQGWKEIEDEYVYRERMVDIQYVRLHTKTIFYPQYLTEFSSISRSAKKNDGAANIYYEKARKRGYEYRAYYHELNLNSQYVQDYLRKLDSYSNPNTELRERAEEVKKDYVLLPDSVPKRVGELAREITSGEQSSYDKMVSICEYLRQYTYTKSVKKPTPDKDFTDEFLWNTKKGYCTYFATAAAVMGRTLNIPTRYVEGMLVTSDCKESKNYYLLDGKCMHAWCEAYFEGFGWVRFEATPGYEDNGGAWEHKDGTGYYEKRPVTPSVMPQPTEDTVVKSDKKSHIAVLRWSVLLLICIAAAVMILAVTWIWNERKERTKKEQCKRLFGHLLFYLKKFGFVLEKGETLIAFRDRVKDGMEIGQENWYELFDSSIEGYLKMRFGDVEPEDEDLKQLEAIIWNLQERCKLKLGMLRYLVILLEEKMLR